jgi:hypothetical protein
MKVRCEASAVSKRPPSQCGARLSSSDRQHHDEGGAEEAAHDRAQAADDDHEQQVERTVDVEGRRLPRAQVHEAPQRAGHADDEGTDREGGELGVHRADADHRGGHVHVADGHPLAADVAAHQVLGQQREHRQEAQAEQVLLGRACRSSSPTRSGPTR